MWPRLEADPITKNSDITLPREGSAFGVSRLDSGSLSPAVREGINRGRDLLQKSHQTLSLALLRYDWGTGAKSRHRLSPLCHVVKCLS